MSGKDNLTIGAAVVTLVAACITSIAAYVTAKSSQEASLVAAQLNQRASLEETGTTWDLERTKEILKLAAESTDATQPDGPAFSDWVCYYSKVFDCTTQVWNAVADYDQSISGHLCKNLQPPEESGECDYTSAASTASE